MKDTKKSIILLSLFAVILLAVVILARHSDGDPLIYGENSFYNKRVSEGIVGGYPEGDDLIYGGAKYVIQPYHFMIAFLNPFLVQIVISVATLVLLYLIAEFFKLDFKTKIVSLLFYVISPIFIYSYTTLNESSAALLFSLLSAYLLTRKNKVFFFLSLLFAIFVPLFGVFYGLIYLVFLAAFYYKFSFRKKTGWVIISLICSTALFWLYTYIKTSIYYLVVFEPVTLKEMISDLGGNLGFSIFLILLMIIGLKISWSKKQKFGVLFTAVLSIAAFSLIQINIYLNIIFSVLAATGFLKLLTMKWHLRTVRNFTALIIILGLVFSSLSYVNSQIRSEPNKEIKESLEFLKDYDDGTVLSHPTRGEWIQYYSGKPVILDSNKERIKDYEERSDDIMDMLHSRNLKKTDELFKKYEVKYIFIDSSMKEGIVWKEEKEGLLFLFRNNETFKNIYAKNDIDIVEVMITE